MIFLSQGYSPSVAGHHLANMVGFLEESKTFSLKRAPMLCFMIQ